MKKNEEFIPGNFEDKYNATNPVSKLLMSGFLKSFDNLLGKFGDPKVIVEVGAADGHLTKRAAELYKDAQIYATDLDDGELEKAKVALGSYKNISISKENAEDLSFKDNYVDAFICCEVIEHVNNPKQAANELYRILKSGQYGIVSVPWEPLWRVLNMVRMKYLKDFGNTPGHLQHFSRRKIMKLLKKAGFEIIEFRKPLPWTMVLVRKP